MSLITETVRLLRRNSTPAEKIFWEAIRGNKIGVKFVRQKPIIFPINKKKKFFVADFYCKEKKIIIEIDGKIHENQQEYDILRTQVINELGIQVLRFKNEEVLERIEDILNKIKKAI